MVSREVMFSRSCMALHEVIVICYVNLKFIVYWHFCYVPLLYNLCQKFGADPEKFSRGVWGCERNVYVCQGELVRDIFLVILLCKFKITVLVIFDFRKSWAPLAPFPSRSKHVMHWLDFKLWTNVALYWNEMFEKCKKEKDS